MKENQQKQKLFCQEKKNNKRTKNYIYIMVLMEIILQLQFQKPE